MEDMLNFLDDYFEKTPKEALKAKFDKYNQAKYEGVTIQTYLQNFAEQHNFLPSLENTKKEQIQDVTTSLRTDKEAEKEQDSYSSAA